MSLLGRLGDLRRSRWWTLLVRPLLFLAVSFLVARILISLVGSVDWQQVAAALGQVGWVQAPALIALLLLRQSLNAVPLAVFVPGLGFWRGLQNDLTANLVGTVAPPPGDVVVRVSMFRSWGIPAVDGMPGVTLNSLVFYVIRFSVPIVGVLLLLGDGVAGSRIWLAIGSLVLACLMVSGSCWSRAASGRRALSAKRPRGSCRGSGRTSTRRCGASGWPASARPCRAGWCGAWRRRCCRCSRWWWSTGSSSWSRCGWSAYRTTCCRRCSSSAPSCSCTR